MSRSFQVADLLLRLRRLGDYETVIGKNTGDYSDDRFTDPILTDFLSVSYARAYEELADADAGWSETYYTFSAFGSGSYPLPTDMYRLRSVEGQVQSTNTTWVPIPRATVDDDRYSSDLAGYGIPVAYREVGDSIELLPLSGSATVRLRYVQEPAVLSGSTQFVTGDCGMDQLTVLGALRLCRISEERPIAEVERLYDEQLARSVRSLKRRDRGSPRHLRDPRDSRYPGWPFRRGV